MYNYIFQEKSMSFSRCVIQLEKIYTTWRSTIQMRIAPNRVKNTQNWSWTHIQQKHIHIHKRVFSSLTVGIVSENKQRMRWLYLLAKAERTVKRKEQRERDCYRRKKTNKDCVCVKYALWNLWQNRVLRYGSGYMVLIKPTHLWPLEIIAISWSKNYTNAIVLCVLCNNKCFYMIIRKMVWNSKLLI